MAHFAKIVNNLVTDVIVVSNDALNNSSFPESEQTGQEFIASLGIDGLWLQTSYNGNFRGVYAGIGYLYDDITDSFIEPEIIFPINEEVQ